MTARGNTYFAKVGKLFIIAFLGSLELSCCSVAKWLMFEVERPVNGRLSGCFCYLAGESLRFLLNSPKKLFSLVTFFFVFYVLGLVFSCWLVGGWKITEVALNCCLLFSVSGEIVI